MTAGVDCGSLTERMRLVLDSRTGCMTRRPGSDRRGLLLSRASPCRQTSFSSPRPQSPPPSPPQKRFDQPSRSGAELPVLQALTNALGPGVWLNTVGGRFGGVWGVWGGVGWGGGFGGFVLGGGAIWGVWGGVEVWGLRRAAGAVLKVAHRIRRAACALMDSQQPSAAPQPRPRPQKYPQPKPPQRWSR